MEIINFKKLPSRRHNDLKCICTEQQSLKLQEAKADGAKRSNRCTIRFDY